MNQSRYTLIQEQVGGVGWGGGKWHSEGKEGLKERLCKGVEYRGEEGNTLG